MVRTGVSHSKVFLFVQEDRLWKIQKPNSSAAFSANNQPRVLVLGLPQQFLEVIVLVFYNINVSVELVTAKAVARISRWRYLPAVPGPQHRWMKVRSAG